MGNRNYEDVEREVDRQLNERTRLRKKREADIRKTLGMRVDGLRYVVVECMQLLYVDKGEVVGDVRVLSIFETNPT